MKICISILIIAINVFKEKLGSEVIVSLPLLLSLLMVCCFSTCILTFNGRSGHMGCFKSKYLKAMTGYFSFHFCGTGSCVYSLEMPLVDFSYEHK